MASLEKSVCGFTLLVHILYPKGKDGGKLQNIKQQTTRSLTILLCHTVSHQSKRSPPFPPGLFRWIPALLTTSDEDMKTRMGLDRYMFIRLLRMGIILFSICTLFCVPILIPLNVIDGNGSSGINVMTLGNVRHTGRTWAHTWLAVLVSGKFSKGTGQG